MLDELVVSSSLQTFHQENTQGELRQVLAAPLVWLPSPLCKSLVLGILLSDPGCSCFTFLPSSVELLVATE